MDDSIIEVPDHVTEDMVECVALLFPHVQRAAIRADLGKTLSSTVTINRILDGTAEVRRVAVEYERL